MHSRDGYESDDEDIKTCAAGQQALGILFGVLFGIVSRIMLRDFGIGTALLHTLPGCVIGSCLGAYAANVPDILTIELLCVSLLGSFVGAVPIIMLNLKIELEGNIMLIIMPVFSTLVSNFAIQRMLKKRKFQKKYFERYSGKSLV